MKIEAAIKKEISLDFKLNFGKHKDKIVRDAMKEDSDWFYWAIREEVILLDDGAHGHLVKNYSEPSDNGYESYYAYMNERYEKISWS